MKSLKSLFIVVAMTVVVSAVNAEEKVEFEFRADYFGKYLLRGMDLVDDPVFQPKVSASYRGFTASLWGNFETTCYNDRGGECSELDWSLIYSGKLTESIGYSIGAIHYDFPNTIVDDTTELTWSLNFDLPLNPSVTVYHDVDEVSGTYASFALGHNIEKIAEIGGKPVGMNIGAALGMGTSHYNEYYWGIEQSKISDLAFNISFPVDVCGWTLAPSLNYVTLIGNDLRSVDVYNTSSDYFFAGISLSKKF